MLSVGREIRIARKDVFCRNCHWESTGNNLSTGLIRIDHAYIYLVAYRCPECGSFDVAYKGKLLQFRLPQMDDRDHGIMKTREHLKRDKAK
jgi:RNase P subunit RPR2